MSKHVLTLIFGIIGFMSLGIGSVSALPVEDISTISINASDFMTRFEEKYPSEFSYSKWEDADKKFSMGTKGDAPLVARRAAEKFKNEFYLVENTGYSQKELFETSASLVRNIEGQAGVNDSMKVLASIDPTVPSIEIGVDSSLGAKLSGSIMPRLTSLAGHSSSPATLNARQSMTISSNSVLLEKLSLDINIGGVSLTPQALYGGGRISGNEIGYCTTGFSATKPGYSQGFITAGIHGGEYHKEDNTYHSYFTTISKAESVTGAKIKMS